MTQWLDTLDAWTIRRVANLPTKLGKLATNLVCCRPVTCGSCLLTGRNKLLYIRRERSGLCGWCRLGSRRFGHIRPHARLKACCEIGDAKCPQAIKCKLGTTLVALFAAVRSDNGHPATSKHSGNPFGEIDQEAGMFIDANHGEIGREEL